MLTSDLVCQALFSRAGCQFCLLAPLALLGLHELKREENQDKSYRQFLSDLSSTIEKEKEERNKEEIKEGAVDVSFDTPEEKEKGPEGVPLPDLEDPTY